MKITAVVIARKGSKRVPNKANQLFWNSERQCEETLVERKINQLKKVKVLDEIVVGSNDEQVLDTAVKLGVTPLLREEKFCDEMSSTVNAMVQDVLSRIKSDIILWAHPTNPFISQKQYDTALDLHFSLGNIDVVSATELSGYYLDDAYFPINFKFGEKRHRPARCLNTVYRLNGGIFVRKYKDMLNDGSFLPKHPAYVIMNEITGWDIDYPWQLELAQEIARKGLNET